MKDITSNRDGTIESYIVDTYQTAGQVDRALQVCIEALDTFPKNPQLRLQRADLIAEQGRVEAALELLQAIADLPDKVHVAFLGSGYQDKFADDVQRLGLAGRAHFVPPVKPFEVVPFVRGADAAAILYYARSVNYAYSLPNGFFQSVAAELPVLYPDLIEIKKVAEHFDIGVRIDPRNSQSLRAGIETLRNDTGRYEQLRRNLSKARITLDWENEEKQLHELLANILAEKA